MAENVESAIQTLNLSAQSIKAMTGWPDPMTNDYLTNLRNFIEIAQQADVLIGRVTVNETNIELNRVAIEEHIADNSAHGVTGENVGDEDFCTGLVGGVVLLMELVNNAANSTAEVALSDLGAAPGAYNQAYTQSQSTLINDIKAKHNTMLNDLNAAIFQLNDLIAKSKAAKQMAVS